MSLFSFPVGPFHLLNATVSSGAFLLKYDIFDYFLLEFLINGLSQNFLLIR